MMFWDYLVTVASKELLARGIKVLQGNRLAAVEKEHIERLARFMELNGEMTIADMGSGFGEVARGVGAILPRCHFYLVNTNRFQLDHDPEQLGFTKLQEDMCSTSIPRESVDLVMFNYSLCHVDAFEALGEAARIARPKGKLFVYDYERIGGNNRETYEQLASRFLRDDEFRETADKSGWEKVETIYPGGDGSLFRELFNDKALYDRMFAELRPVIWRAKRRDE